MENDMTMSNAERQARHRKKHGRKALNDWRLDVVIDSTAYFGLERLAEHYKGVTKRQLLERLIRAEEDRVTAGFEGDPEKHNKYYEYQIKKRVRVIRDNDNLNDV